MNYNKKISRKNNNKYQKNRSHKNSKYLVGGATSTLDDLLQELQSDENVKGLLTNLQPDTPINEKKAQILAIAYNVRDPELIKTIAQECNF